MSFANLSDDQRAMLQAQSARCCIVDEVLEECERQVVKWGLQRRPGYTQLDALDHAEHFETQVTTDMAKAICDFKIADGTACWMDILLEEFMEARDEAKAGNKAALREELIQVAAVVVSAIQDLDRTEAENARG